MGLQLFLGWYQMFSAAFQCSQLFSDVLSWVITLITTPSAVILWSSLYVVGNRIGPNSTAIGKPLVVAFLSHLEVSWRFKVSVRVLLSYMRSVSFKSGIFITVIWESIFSEITTHPTSHPKFCPECWNLLQTELNWLWWLHIIWNTGGHWETVNGSFSIQFGMG